MFSLRYSAVNLRLLINAILRDEEIVVRMERSLSPEIMSRNFWSKITATPSFLDGHWTEGLRFFSLHRGLLMGLDDTIPGRDPAIIWLHNESEYAPFNSTQYSNVYRCTNLYVGSEDDHRIAARVLVRESQSSSYPSTRLVDNNHIVVICMLNNATPGEIYFRYDREVLFCYTSQLFMGILVPLAMPVDYLSLIRSSVQG